MGDYLSDSVIRYYPTQKPPVIQIFKIHFSHADCTLARLSHTEWFLCSREAECRREELEWRAELPGDTVLLIIHDRRQNVSMQQRHNLYVSEMSPSLVFLLSVAFIFQLLHCYCWRLYTANTHCHLWFLFFSENWWNDRQRQVILA